MHAGFFLTLKVAIGMGLHGQPTIAPSVALPDFTDGGWAIMAGTFLMTKTSSSKSRSGRRRAQRRKTQPLLFNGIGALVAGAILWLVSLTMGVDQSLRSAAKALLAPAWMALGLGVGLLVLHVLSKRRAQAEAAMLLRQHSTFLEPMPRLKPQRKEKPRFPEQRSRSSATGR